MAKKSNTMNQILKTIEGEIYKRKEQRSHTEAQIRKKNAMAKNKATQYNSIMVNSGVVNIFRRICFNNEKDIHLKINEILVEWLEDNENDIKKAIFKASEL